MYNYQQQRPFLFTEYGQVMFLKVRDNVKALLIKAGAVRMNDAISNVTGDSWNMIACVDRLVELKEIREITGNDTPGQYRVFVGINS